MKIYFTNFFATANSLYGNAPQPDNVDDVVSEYNGGLAELLDGVSDAGEASELSTWYYENWCRNH